MDVHSILVAEDDPLIRRVTEVALKRDGFTVTVVTDGTEALQRLEESTFDLILLDGMMPRMDGIEACRRIKADPRVAHIPVIFLSARSQNVEERAGLEAGAIGYIRKPFDATALGRRIREICADPAEA